MASVLTSTIYGQGGGQAAAAVCVFQHEVSQPNLMPIASSLLNGSPIPTTGLICELSYPGDANRELRMRRRSRTLVGCDQVTLVAKGVSLQVLSLTGRTDCSVPTDIYCDTVSLQILRTGKMGFADRPI